jgi:histidinol-phosphate/aromatic aminotransferase/cobyric acid decarboxylase-like protein
MSTVKQSEKGFFEECFEKDLPLSELERMIALFPDTKVVTDHLLELRQLESITDMKRGELYPEVIGGGTRLRRTIAKVYGIEMVQAQPNFGCNGCIDTFLSYIQWLECTSSRRKGILVATPTYFRYHHKVEALRIKLLGVPFKPDFKYPVDEVLTTLKEGSPSCLLLVTPNNPTGLPLPDEQLFDILDNVPDDINVAIDRTCANIDPEISTKSLLKKYPHKRIAIFHSFSKYYGMSHLRIGFTVFSNVEMAAEVDRYVPFGLNLEAILKATYILTTTGELGPDKRILSFIKENREAMKKFLERHENYDCSDFKSNYAVLLLPKQLSSREFNRRLVDKGILVMPGPELPNSDERAVRIHTGGPPLYMSRMLEALERLN